jgi:4-amino-4-deoxy-L-arabinose transferase-like glycosyltransferase
MMTERAVLLIILCVLIALSTLGFSALPAPYGDNARYIIVAQSLAAGKGMALANAPEQPQDTKYPPGYPLLLAGLIRIFGYHLALLNALSLLCTLATVAIAWKFTRVLGFTGGMRILLAGIFALHPLTLEYSRVTLIEAAFVLALLSALYCLARFESENKAAWLRAAGALMIGAFCIRYSAIILTVAFIFVLRRNKTRAGLIGICGLTLLLLAAAFFYSGRNFSGSYFAEILDAGNYLRPGNGTIGLTGIAGRYAYNAAAYAGNVLPETILPVTRYILPHTFWWPAKILLGLGCLAAMGAGFFRLWRREGARNSLVFVLVYGLLLPAFPTYGSRYVFAVLFFVLVLALAGMEQLFRRRAPAVLAAAGAIFAAGAICVTADIGTIRQGFEPQWRNFYRSLDFIKEHAPAQAVVVCRKPFLAYLVAQRRAVGFPATADTGRMMEYLRRIAGAYVIVDSIDIAGIRFSQRFLEPAVRDYGDTFELLYRLEAPQTAVYKVKTEP